MRRHNGPLRNARRRNLTENLRPVAFPKNRLLHPLNIDLAKFRVTYRFHAKFGKQKRDKKLRFVFFN